MGWATRTSDAPRSLAWSAGIPVAVFVLAYLLPLGVRPYSAPDEARYAEVAREMVASGDWVVPRLDGLRYFEKPPLGYWLNALSQAVFGENEFAMRLPAALSIGLTALIVAALLAHGGRDRRIAAIGATGVLTTFAMYAGGTLNVLDGQLCLWLTAAIASAFMAAATGSARARRRWLVLTGVACGLAFLTKGFLAFVIPALVLVPFLAWERRLLEMLRSCWIPVVVAFAVAAPWSIAMALREPSFWHYFVVEEHLQRFAGEEAQHERPVWYFVPILLLGGLPWSLLLPRALAGLRRGGSASPLVRLALCWLAFPFLFLTASTGKLAMYLLPCFPALVILVASSVPALLEGRGLRTLGWCSSVLGALLVAAGGTALGMLLSGHSPQVVEHDPETLVTLAVGLLAAGGLALLAARTGRPLGRLGLFTLWPVALFLVVPFAVPTSLISRFPEERIVSIAGRIDADTLLVSDKSYVQAAAWTLRRSDILMLGSPSELEHGLGFEDAGRRHVRPAELDALLRCPHRSFDVVCILHDTNHGARLAYPAPSWSAGGQGMLLLAFAPTTPPDDADVPADECSCGFACDQGPGP